MTAGGKGGSGQRGALGGREAGPCSVGGAGLAGGGGGGQPQHWPPRPMAAPAPAVVSFRACHRGVHLPSVWEEKSHMQGGILLAVSGKPERVGPYW